MRHYLGYKANIMISFWALYIGIAVVFAVIGH